MTYTVTLPTDPKTHPIASGAGGTTCAAMTIDSRTLDQNTGTFNTSACDNYLIGADWLSHSASPNQNVARNWKFPCRNVHVAGGRQLPAEHDQPLRRQLHSGIRAGIPCALPRGRTHPGHADRQLQQWRSAQPVPVRLSG
jgi:hypothetical protein